MEGVIWIPVLLELIFVATGEGRIRGTNILSELKYLYYVLENNASWRSIDFDGDYLNYTLTYFICCI